MEIDHARLHLRPMNADEYEVFHARSTREYAEEIAANVGITVAEAQHKSDADFASLLPDGLDTPGQHLFVIAAGDGTRVGELWMGVTDKPGGREAFGYDFFVLPELRDRGIGRRAMALAAEAAREVGAVRLALNVFGDNERARHLYASYGFEVTNVNMVKRLVPEPPDAAI